MTFAFQATFNRRSADEKNVKYLYIYELHFYLHLQLFMSHAQKFKVDSQLT